LKNIYFFTEYFQNLDFQKKLRWNNIYILKLSQILKIKLSSFNVQQDTGFIFTKLRTNILQSKLQKLCPNLKELTIKQYELFRDKAPFRKNERKNFAKIS